MESLLREMKALQNRMALQEDELGCLKVHAVFAGRRLIAIEGQLNLKKGATKGRKVDVYARVMNTREIIDEWAKQDAEDARDKELAAMHQKNPSDHPEYAAFFKAAAELAHRFEHRRADRLKQQAKLDKVRECAEKKAQRTRKDVRRPRQGQGC